MTISPPSVLCHLSSSATLTWPSWFICPTSEGGYEQHPEPLSSCIIIPALWNQSPHLTNLNDLLVRSQATLFLLWGLLSSLWTSHSSTVSCWFAVEDALYKFTSKLQFRYYNNYYFTIVKTATYTKLSLLLLFCWQLLILVRLHLYCHWFCWLRWWQWNTCRLLIDERGRPPKRRVRGSTLLPIETVTVIKSFNHNGSALSFLCSMATWCPVLSSGFWKECNNRCS